MSKAPAATVTQVRRLCESLRALPADDAARALEQIVTTAQAVQAEVLAEAQRAGELKDCGCRSVRGYAASILRRSVGDASMVAQVALHLADFPKLAEIYRDGRAHTGNLRAVMDAISSCGLDVLQAHEPALVDLALRAGPGEIKQFCQMLADLNHPDRDRKKVRAAGGRMVRLARVGDLMHLDAMIDPALGAQLKATLTAMAKAAAAEQRRHDQERQQHQNQHRQHSDDGPNADSADDTDGSAGDEGGSAAAVPFTQRCADALEAILRHGMDATDLPEQARRRPHAVVHADLRTVLGLPGHGHAYLERFGLIPPGTAATLACDALVRVVLTHGDRVLNAGHTTRLVTGPQRTALGALHRTCVAPGCHVPFADCDIHHLWWWSLLGRTDLDLQVPLCGSHHRSLHDGHLSLTRETGRLVFRDPQGRTLTNTDDALAAQLDLLTQHHPPPGTGPADPTGTGKHDQITDQTTDQAIDQAIADGGWPDSPYQHGTWGWNGHNPSPPPGHAPPQPMGS